MARLESVAKAGYYPTPDRVAEWIGNHLTSDPKGNKRPRLLDPCCGTGTAAETVAKAIKAETYGVELSTPRATEARQHLDVVLGGEGIGMWQTNVKHQQFSALFLNPPYDTDDTAKRMEHFFLTHLTTSKPVLCEGGVLVFIVPKMILSLSARYLAAYYMNHRIYRFPDPEWDAFGQVIIFATRRARGLPNAKLAETFVAMAATDDDGLQPLPEFPDPDVGPLMVPNMLPATSIITPSVFDARAALAEARRVGVWALPAFAEAIAPPADKTVQPLMPFRRGHLAIMVASGLVNNRPIVHPETGQRLLIKGRLEKVMVLIPNEKEDESDEDAEVTREIEKLKTSLVTLDLDTGIILTLEDGPKGEPAGATAEPDRDADDDEGYDEPYDDGEQAGQRVPALAAARY